MFGELPELFNRNFAIGYYLPVTVFVVINAVYADVYGIMPGLLDFTNTSQVNVLVGTTILALISWLLSIILLGVNRELTRMLEGYGKFNPLRLFLKLQLTAYDKCLKKIDELDNQYREYLKNECEIPGEFITKRNQAMWEMVERFPSRRNLVLPTSFGNTLRAFEIYSLDMYGIDAIPGWSRLIAVISKEYKEYIDDTKVFVDFWMNTFYLNIFLLIEYLILTTIFDKYRLWLLPILFALAIFTSYGRACKVAIHWGNTVKAAFDVYLPDLWEKMGFIIPEGKEEKKKLWISFNQAVIYGRPDIMPDRKKLEKDM